MTIEKIKILVPQWISLLYRRLQIMKIDQGSDIFRGIRPMSIDCKFQCGRFNVYHSSLARSVEGYKKSLFTIWFDQSSESYNLTNTEYRKHWKSCNGFQVPWQTGRFWQYWKKHLGPIMSNFWRRFFSCFQGQKNISILFWKYFSIRTKKLHSLQVR